MNKPNGINPKLILVFILILVVMLGAIVLDSELGRAEPMPDCVQIGQTFVDLDGDGDEDYLARGCAVFNSVLPGPPVVEPPPVNPAPDILPTPEVFANPSEL